MEVLCKTWGEMARFHKTFTATQDKFITAFYIKYAKLTEEPRKCVQVFFSPSSLIFSSELENLVKTNHSTWPMAFILSTEHFHKSKLPFNLWHSKSKHYLTQGGEFVTQICRWNWRAGQGKTWALSIVYASTAGCLNAERWRRNITGLMQRAWKNTKSSGKLCISHLQKALGA